MAALRLTPLIAIAFVLGGCATVTDDDGGVAPGAEPKAGDILPNGALPAQEVEPGECALFGFSKSSRKLVFYSSEDEAKYVSSESRLVEVEPDGEFPSARYGPLTLSLGDSEALEGGQRYPFARLTEPQEDGFERVQPLVILMTCETPNDLDNL